MSYAAMAAKNAPPEEEQVHPSQALLDGGFKGDTHTGLPDVDEKLAVVERSWIDHPETTTSIGESSHKTPSAAAIPHHPPKDDTDPHVSAVAPKPTPAPHVPKTNDPIPAEQAAKVKKEAKRVEKEAEAKVSEVADKAQKKGNELADKAEKKGSELADKAEKKGKEVKADAKELASKAKAEASELSEKAKAEAKDLSRKAKAELDEAETVIAKYYEKTKDIVLKPGVLGGLLGVVNVGLLSTLGYYAYQNKDRTWDQRYVGGAVAGTLALFGVEGVVTDKYINTEEGREEARRAKAEGSKIWIETKERVLRPGVAGGLVGALNIAVLTTVGYFTNKHWNARVWDKQIVGGVVVGLVALSGVEGYAASYYKENELPRQKRKGNY